MINATRHNKGQKNPDFWYMSESKDILTAYAQCLIIPNIRFAHYEKLGKILR